MQRNTHPPLLFYTIFTTLAIIEQDDAMMSCCQGRDAMWIDFQAKADVATEFFGDIEKTLKPIGFRKHWAKGLDHTDAGYAMKQFPKMHEFIALMQTIDPKGKFRNNTGESWYNAMGNLIEDMNGMKSRMK